MGLVCGKPLAVIHNQLGNIEQAQYFYFLAKKSLIYQQRYDKLSRLLNNIAVLYKSQHDYDRAGQNFRSGIDLARDIKYPYGEAINRVGLAGICFDLNKWGEGKIQLDSASIYLSDKDVKKNIYGGYLNNLARLHAASGKTLLAIELYLKQRNYYESNNYKPTRREFAKLHHSLSREYLKVDSLSLAKRHIMLGLKKLIPEQTHIFRSRDKLIEENTFIQLYGTLASVYAQWHHKSHRRVYLDSALMAYDVALYVSDLLASQYITDESRYFAAYSNQIEIDGLFEVLYDAQEFNMGVDESRLLSYLQKSKAIVFDRELSRVQMFDALDDASQKRFIEISQDILNLKKNNSLLTDQRIAMLKEMEDQLNSLKRELDESADILNSYFVEYVVGANNVTAIDNFEGKLRLTKIGSTKEIWQACSGFRRAILAENDLNHCMNSGRHLYTLLLSFAENIPESFSIVPDDFLAQIPFEALVDTQGNFLVYNHVIDYRLSLKVLPKKDINFNKVTCVKPDYGADNLQMAYNRSDIYTLKYVQKEVDAIKNIFPKTKVCSGLSNNQWMDVFQSNSVFHFAGHAREDDWNGALILGRNDSTVTGIEIATYPSNLSLAVLSACETGVGETKSGEGSMSMARSFLSTGTRNVVNSLWTVNDQSTADIMKYFYQNIGSSMTLADALRKTKLSYLENNSNEGTHPYYWSGFILTTTAKSEGTNSISIWLIAGLLTIAILFIAIKKHRL